MRFDPEQHVVYAAGRSWRADPSMTRIDDQQYDTFSHHVRCCLVRFESGWSASIIWGSATYSDNHDAGFSGRPFVEEPSTVEVGVLHHSGELRLRRMNEDGSEWTSVESYLDDDQLAELLDRLASLPTDFDYGEPPKTIDEIAADYEQVRAAIEDAGGTPPPPWPDRDR